MALKYKKTNQLKNVPFYSEKTKSFKKKNKKFSNIKFLSELPFFYKKSKKLTNKQLSEALTFSQKKPKRPKRLTEHQILQNIMPLYDSVGISRMERAHRSYAESYDVEVIDRISLSDSLFLAKSSINDLLRDLLRERRGFKYNLYIVVTLKR